jgi:thiol-disulfide isomerase/thioredoxin
MMKTKIFLYTILELCIFQGLGQNQTHLTDSKANHVKKMTLGEQLPNFRFNEVINSPIKVLDLSSMKGQFVIMDFWHTRCAACIAAFPKLQKLQEKYRGKLKIILLTYQSKKTVQNFLVRQNRVTGMDLQLPIACNQQSLTDYFKVPSYPHYVWIDEKGIAQFVTQGYDVTEENIGKVINHQPVNMQQKADSDLDFQIFKPLFVNGNGGIGSPILYYSILTHYIKNMPVLGGYTSPNDSNSAIVAYSYPIVGMFQVAFNDFLNGLRIPDNRTILQVADTSKYVWEINGVTQWDRFYAYQLFSPYRSIDSLQKLMREDLMRYFQVEAHMEMRLMKCWVLRAEDTALLVTKGGYLLNEMSADNFTISIRNVPDSELIFRFVYNIFSKSRFPFISEVHMKSNIDILLDNINFYDEKSVIEALKSKYKLSIQLEDHLVNMLVITEPGFRKKAVN